MKKIIDILPPQLRGGIGKKPSVLAIRTNEQKYLVFSDNSASPTYVLQPGDMQSLSTIKDYTYKLHQAMPGRIPEPLAILPQQGDDGFLVQSGIDGLPWFTLEERVGNKIPWSTIADQSLGALSDFHAATSAVSSWNKRCDLFGYFEHLSGEIAELESNVLSEHPTVSAACLTTLSELRSIDCFPQHGDFCVNNLIFGENSVGVIDFEHIGEVYLPLHDEFLIAVSLLTFHKDPTLQIASDLWTEILAQSKYAHIKDTKIINTLLIMHLMWWLIESQGLDHRSERRKIHRRALRYACNEMMLDNLNSVEKILLNASGVR